MLKRRSIPTIALAAVLVLGACGDESGGTKAGPQIGSAAASIPAAPVETNIQTLVPENTDILLYVPSTDALLEKVQRVAAVFGDEVAENLELDEMLGQIAGPLTPYLDRSKPMAVAAAMPATKEGQPVPTMILPMTDMDAALKVFEENGQEAPQTKGAYVLMAMGPPAKPATQIPEIAKQVPQGDLVVRANLEKVVDLFGPDIRKGMEQASQGMAEGTPPGGPDLSGMLEGMQDFTKDLLDSAQFFDLALQIEDTDVHLRALFTMKEGSKLAQAAPPTGDLAAMSAAIHADAPVVAMINMDFEKLMGWIEPMMDSIVEALPEEQKATFRTQWSKAMALYEHAGDRMVFGYDLDEDGLGMTAVLALDDAQKYFAAWNEMLEDGGYQDLMATMGMGVTRLPNTTVAGFEVQHLAMTVDVEKMMEWNPGMADAPPEAAEMSKQVFETMFGEDGMQLHMADVGGNLVMVMGDEAAMEGAIQRAAGTAAPASGALADAIAKAGGKPTFLLHVEGRSMLQGIFAMVRKMMPPEETADMPEIPDGKPLNLLFYASGGGRYYAGGMSVDVGALKDIVETFQNAMR